ncbi:unnamed protein product [Prorocentrum cordatum]|uniref:Decapping nuclease n=1 Tax=Prorocentrum cordatum TaxID=2364126 RepID=A0ABN9QZ53_9DINO|nr:unnamed protein product [Polarella glacialis]
MWAFCLRVSSSARKYNARQDTRVTFCALVLPSSHFSFLHHVVPTRTADLYQGLPLAHLIPKSRGEVLAIAARSIIADLGHADRAADPVPGRCVNGRQRPQHQAEYDWLCNGRRIECKSSQLQFNRSCSSWLFQFHGVKLALQAHRVQDAFDDLVLVLYSPCRIYIYRHDLTTGLSTAGIRTSSRGHSVTIRSAKTLCWRTGLESILAKLDAGTNACERLADIPLYDSRINVAASRRSTHAMHDVYNNVPLASLSPPARGLVLQRLAQEVDYIMSQRACVSSRYTALHDWIRDGVRVECKSAKLVWCGWKKSWRVSFAHVKIKGHMKQSSVFDELHVVIFSPRGIYIYHHDLKLGVSSAGLATQAEGCDIVICGSKKAVSWSEGLDSILSKLDRGGCRRLAHIHWDSAKTP